MPTGYSSGPMADERAEWTNVSLKDHCRRLETELRSLRAGQAVQAETHIVSQPVFSTTPYEPNAQGWTSGPQWTKTKPSISWSTKSQLRQDPGQLTSKKRQDRSLSRDRPREERRPSKSGPTRREESKKESKMEPKKEKKSKKEKEKSESNKAQPTQAKSEKKSRKSSSATKVEKKAKSARKPVIDGLLMQESNLPSSDWTLTKSEVRYRKKELVFSRSIDRSGTKAKGSLNSTACRLLVNSLSSPVLPIPCSEDPMALKQKAWMYLKPAVQKAIGHDGCGCQAHGLSRSYHRPAVLPDTCLKNGLLSEDKVAVKPPGLLLYENQGRVFTYSEEADNQLLSQPQPFLISSQWPTKLYQPTMASAGPSEPKAMLYYGLYSAGRFREVAQTYQEPPSQWKPRTSPYYSEPKPESELGLVAKEMHGLETLLRTGFCAHPGREPHLRFYLATNRDNLAVPIMENSLKPGDLENAVVDIMRPFYSNGSGKVLCPVCIMVEKRGQLEPVFLSKVEYSLHWEAEHYSSLVASSIFSATQLHTRIFMGHLLYLLVLANKTIHPEADINAPAYDEKVLKDMGSRESYHLQNIWKAAKSNGKAAVVEMGPSKAASPVLSEEEIKLLDSEDELMVF